MFKHYFELVDNVAIWPVIALIIFFTFFVGLFIWVYRADKSYINQMSALPMDGEALVGPKNAERHEAI